MWNSLVLSMDEQTTVPLAWLFILSGGLIITLVSAFTWWLRAEWKRNWEEHLSMRNDAKKAHGELDVRIDRHHQKIDSHLDRIHSRIDWLISHEGIPKYEDSKEG